MLPNSSESLSDNSRLYIAIGIGLACVLNYFPLDFFTGSQLVFGNVIAVAITLLFGFRYGAICTLLAGLVTWVNWQHFYILLPFFLEIAVIAWALKKGKSPFLYSIRYWSTLGWMIVALQYFVLSDYMTVTNFAITIKYVVNGVVNVMLGYALAYVVRGKVKGHFREVLSFSRIIAISMFIALATGLLLNTYYWLKRYQNEALANFQHELHLESEIVASNLEEFLTEHLHALSFAAELNKNEALSWQSVLEGLGVEYPDILTLLSTDKDGNLTASYPPELFGRLKTDDRGFFNVADRPYFYEVKANREDFVSDVFRVSK